MMKRLIITMVCFLTVIISMAQTNGITGDLNWNLNNGILTINGNGNMPNYSYGSAPWNNHRSEINTIVINDGVKNIGYSAFSSCISLLNITIPNSVTKIGLYAFSRCQNLTSITIPNGVITIEDHAFSECNNLETIIIPNSVVDIDYNAFYETAWLNNQADGVVYAGKVLYTYKGIMPENTVIEVQDGILGIANFAFSERTELISITIPESVMRINSQAFLGCTNLKTVYYNAINAEVASFSPCSAISEVIIGENVQTIPNQIFRFCVGLKAITIPESVNFIGDNAFAYCENIVIVNFNAISCTTNEIGSSQIFFQCHALKTINFGNSVKKIPRGSFSDCNGLKSVLIPEGVENIGKDAFYNCEGLNTLTIPSTVTFIGDGAFQSCKNLSTVNYNAIDCSIEASNSCIFKFCNSIKAFNIGKSVKKIPPYFFSVCEGPESLLIPKGVSSIGDQAFYGCVKIPEITIPESVVFIGSLAFGNCTNLSSINFNARDCNTSFSPFSNCPSLTTISIGAEVTKIPDQLLLRSNVKIISIPEGVKTIGAHSFCECKELTSVTFPKSLISIGEAAFSGCNKITKIDLSESVTTLGAYAFYGCTSLTNITAHSMIPASCATSTFEDVNINTCILHVPKQSIPLYEKARGWRDFLNISEDIITEASFNSEISIFNLSIYPNPAKLDLFIQSDSPIEKVEIYNQSGICVLVENVFMESINVSALSDGFYFARIYIDDIPVIKKFIVRK